MIGHPEVHTHSGPPSIRLGDGGRIIYLTRRFSDTLFIPVMEKGDELIALGFAQLGTPPSAQERQPAPSGKVVIIKRALPPTPTVSYIAVGHVESDCRSAEVASEQYTGGDSATTVLVEDSVAVQLEKHH